ncbi:MAG: type II toxin-antitoxin system PemK/MazF family toxin [Sulfurovum sp.]|nr:type II toxin-antitoxin system PemK/MazF family toxin [Sulfurovum sp.]NNJ45066.1 type II toxin-antitoxin system PemK/MazF family toxin [Sulfurovum sp.]
MLIFQNNASNKSDDPTTIVLLWTTKHIDNAQPIRMRIGKREKLTNDTDMIVTHIRAIGNARFVEYLGSLTEKELYSVNKPFLEIIE